MRTGLLLVERRKELERILAQDHTTLIRIVSSNTGPDGAFPGGARLLAALKAQQKAWLAYRSEECELVGSLSGAGGSWPSTHASQCEVDRTEQRLRRVRAAIRCVESLPLEKRWLEQNECLEPLAPLTHGQAPSTAPAGDQPE
ncbi:MAG: lysozyme inhibitor LprI family protein [Synechococcaceae cyanobacterium]|nr:lysozyme inhibitor LprI family protein [Synechococcaceae cyanobacterium]